MAMYQTFEGVNRRLDIPYVGIDGVQRMCDRGFVGIDGKRHQFYGVLEGITQAAVVIYSCGAGDTVENSDPNSDVQYTIENQVFGMAAVNSVGSISYSSDASGNVTIEVSERVSGKTISLLAWVEVEFDNVRSARLARIFQHYIAPVRIPIQAYVESQSSDPSTPFMTGHNVYVGNQPAWDLGVTGLGELKQFQESSLDHDIFQVIAGSRSGSGTTVTKMILPDGIYIDNKRVPLVVRNQVT